MQGHCDESVLTPQGESQALKVAEALRGIDLDAIWASPLQRARRTAEIIGQSLGMATPQFTDDLKEVSLPLWEGMPFKEAEARYPEAFDRWSRDPA
ncbi:MAG: histidine phosphatase family protein, partial [Nodosilinea sp.]